MKIYFIYSGHIQVCYLQERIISLPFFETEKVSADIETNAKRLYGSTVHVNFSPEDLQAEKEILVHVTLPKPSKFIYLFIFHIYINIHKYKLSVLINFLFTELVLKVKKQGDELYRQIFLTKLTFGELREKISTKFQLKIEEISTIVLLPDIAILDDDDVGTLTTGDVLEIRINCGMYFWFFIFIFQASKMCILLNQSNYHHIAEV